MSATPELTHQRERSGYEKAAEGEAPAGDGKEWLAWVAERFPAYLFPASATERISREEAERFLRHFAGGGAELELVMTASLFMDPDKRELLKRLAFTDAPHLARNLPSAARVESRTWEGAYRGRLDVAATLALHTAGQPTRFVTRDRRRTWALPETVLLKVVLGRLHERLSLLREAGVAKREHWGALLLDVEAELRLLLTRTLLQHVPEEPFTPRHLDAAARARHPAYGQALHWHRWLTEAEGSDEERARHLARGALFPLSLDTRFEVAVLLKLVEGLRATLEPEGWTFEHSAVRAGREAVATLCAPDGRRVEVVFNQACFPTRERDALLERYVGAGRMRPDITVLVKKPETPTRAMVIEVKRTQSEDYRRQGLEEALFYRYELGGHLIDAPKAVLVGEKQFRVEPTAAEPVIAVGWQDWPHAVVLDGIKRAAEIASR